MYILLSYNLDQTIINSLNKRKFGGLFMYKLVLCSLRGQKREILLRMLAPEFFSSTAQDAIITINWFDIDPTGADILHMSY
jgi:hypothetical protein